MDYQLYNMLNNLDEKVDNELAEIRKDLKEVLVHVTRLTKQELKGDIK